MPGTSGFTPFRRHFVPVASEAVRRSTSLAEVADDVGRIRTRILGDMKLLSFAKGLDDVVEVLKDFSCDVALQAAHDLSFAAAFESAAGNVGAGSGFG